MRIASLGEVTTLHRNRRCGIPEIGPATEISSLWHSAIRERGDTPTFALAVATDLVTAVLTAAEGRADWHDTFDETIVSRLPEVDELSTLRSLLRDRVSQTMPLDQALGVLDRCNAAVDRLIADRTSHDLAALQSVAFLDPLTGVGNRRALDRDLTRELARAIRHDRKVSVAAIDLDGLKSINDEHGHAAGDQALRSLARVLAETVRTGDSVYRVGGDEFVVVLPETEGATVGPLLDRCLTAAPRFSFGVATAPDDANKAAPLLDIADTRLIEWRRNARAGQSVPPRPRRETTAAAPAPRTPEDPLLDIADATPPPGGGTFEEIVVVSRDQTLDVEVAVRIGGTVVRGRAGGSSVAAAAPKIAAAAVIDALASVEPGLAGTYVDGVDILRVGSIDVAVITAMLPTGGSDDRFTGSALVRDRGPLEAAARAALDALNLRLVAPVRP